MSDDEGRNRPAQPEIKVEDETSTTAPESDVLSTGSVIDKVRRLSANNSDPASVRSTSPSAKMSSSEANREYLTLKLRHIEGEFTQLSDSLEAVSPDLQDIEANLKILRVQVEDTQKLRRNLINSLMKEKNATDSDAEEKAFWELNRRFIKLEVKAEAKLKSAPPPSKAAGEAPVEDPIVVVNRLFTFKENAAAEVTSHLDYLRMLVDGSAVDRLPGQLDKVRIYWESYSKINEDFMTRLADVGSPSDYQQQNQNMCFLLQRKMELERKAQLLITAAEPQQPNASAHADFNSEFKAIARNREHLPKLANSVMEWPPFWSHFEDIDTNAHIKVATKLQLLIQSTREGSEARDIVNSYLSSGNYAAALEHLRNMYGRESLLIKVYSRELLQLAFQKEKMEFRKLVTTLTAHIRNLETLGVTADKSALVLYPTVEACLPQHILTAWQHTPGQKDDLGLLMKFLQEEVVHETERYHAQFQLNPSSSERSGNGKHRKTSSKESPAPTAAAAFHSQDSSNLCIFCNRHPHSNRCRSAWNMTLPQRTEVVKKSGACFICLDVGHSSRSCPNRGKVTCGRCNKQHCKLLCPEENGKGNNNNNSGNNSSRSGSSSNSQSSAGTNTNLNSNEGGAPGLPPPDGVPPSQPSGSTSLNSCVESAAVPLQIIPIIVTGLNGRRKIVRALLDTGSQKSYIVESLQREMGFQIMGEEELTHHVFGGASTGSHRHMIVKLHATGVVEDFPCDFDVWCVPKISGALPAPAVGPWTTEFQRRGVTFQDLQVPAPAEILIGNDVVPRLYTGRIEDLGTGPVAMETRWGWVLCGKLPLPDRAQRSRSMMVTHTLMSLPLPSLWDLDTIGIRDEAATQSKEELAALTQQHFEETVRRKDDGRFSVMLPFISGSQSTLPSNYFGAEKRLRSTTEKLKKDGYLEKYHQLFQQWESDGMIEEVPPTNAKDMGHYLPHRAVVKLSSATTPIRPVFDASAKPRGKRSLNDCLEKGPNYLELIPSLLTRFRLDKIGVTADVKKAFQQIEVDPQHRDYLRFLWWTDLTCTEIKVYRHTRVVFGVTSSPFLLAATLKYLLEQSPPSHITTAQTLLQSLYVDNVVGSVPNIEAGQLLQKQSRELLDPAQLDLRGWEFGPVQEGGKFIPILGLLWNTADDTLSLDLKSALELIGKGTTPRAVLSLAHTLYDPLGIIAPFMIKVKMIMSKLHHYKLGWDDTLPQEIQDEFLHWSQQIPYLDNLTFNRFCFWTEGSNRSLHIFSDASGDAYAAVVYLRLQTPAGVKIALLQAKARVAPPKKKLTIPRLELMGCLIGARLTKAVLEDLGNPEISIKYWTDSSTALAWITGEGPWAVFVQNRVNEIQQLTRQDQWKHVPGKLNPADFPSRGCSAPRLLHTQWWSGPGWLHEPEESWPMTVGELNQEEVLQEKRKSVSSNLVARNSAPIDEFLRISHYPHMLRAVAMWSRVRTNLLHRVHRKKNTDLIPQPVPASISEGDMKEAEVLIIRHCQRRLLEEPNRIKKLRPFKDNKGLLRTKTRLLEEEEIEINPIILPDEEEFAKRLVRNLHDSNCHIGTQLLLAKVRENFWLLNGRRAARKIVKSCWTCKRFNTRRLEVSEPPLPITRTGAGVPFNVIGVDMAGPLTLRNKKKVWIALFTCASYRAVHLEVVDNMTTDEFFAAFRRFVARRGKPTTVYSDNGLNFVGANTALQKVYKRHVEVFALDKRINWIFNPPAAAWFGGFYERLIGLTKQLLRKVLGQRIIHQKELELLLLEVEESLNNRPLTYLTEDPDDPLPLTPNMLIRNSGLAYFPELDVRDATSARGAHKRVQKLRESLRSRFRKEYLGQLKFERKQRNTLPTLKPGDVVLVEMDNAKRQAWPLAVIVGVAEGGRRYFIKTKSGVMERAAQRLFPMELAEEVEAQQQG